MQRELAVSLEEMGLAQMQLAAIEHALGTDPGARAPLHVEMTIPAAWGECALFVNGRPDTTFTLYEFSEPAP